MSLVLCACTVKRTADSQCDLLLFEGEKVEVKNREMGLNGTNHWFWKLSSDTPGNGCLDSTLQESVLNKSTLCEVLKPAVQNFWLPPLAVRVITQTLLMSLWVRLVAGACSLY